MHTSIFFYIHFFAWCSLQDQGDVTDEIADNVDLAAKNTRGGAINMTQVSQY